MQAEQLQHALGIRDHFFQFVVAVFRLDDFDQLDLVELMHANHAARADARRARLAAKTRRVSAITDRQLPLRPGFPRDEYWPPASRRSESDKFAELLLVVALGHAVILVFEFRELSHTLETLRPDHERRRHFGVTVSPDVQIEQELNQRPLQPGAPIGVENKAAAATKLRIIVSPSFLFRQYRCS